MIIACPVCESKALCSFFRASGVPVHCCRLWESQAEATAAPRGDIELVLCSTCGMIFNRRFDDRLIDYDGTYENAVHFSPHFQRFAEDLVDGLIEHYGLRGKHLLEVGCGTDAHFLRLLCERAGATGTGFDPSYHFEASAGTNVRIVNQPFAREHTAEAFDFACSRHVLEHVRDPRAFLQEVRLTLGRTDVPVYLEVPSGDQILRDHDFWEAIYEHFGYFTQSMLARLLAATGFEPQNAYEQYGGQFLAVEALTAAARPLELLSEAEAGELVAATSAFGEAFRARVANIEALLQRLRGQGSRVALWGAGSRAVCFLNMVPAARQIDAVIDINPRKHGKHIPGTGQQILPPEALLALQTGVVLLMNPLYEAEVSAQLAALGSRARVIVEGAQTVTV